MPPLPRGDLESMHISAQGDLWVMAFRDGEFFARLDGASWRVYPTRDIETLFYSPSNEFVLDGEQLWVAGGTSVLRWDGAHWQRFRDQKADTIVAANGEAWALDRKGRLSHYAAGAWSPIPADPPVEKWTDDTYKYSKFIRTVDGSLWLMRDRLWSFDGTRWRQVPTVSESVRLLGTNGNQVWVWYNDSLHSVSAEGADSAVYTCDQTGISDDDIVAESVSRGGLTWIGTWSRPLVFDGENWRRLPMPPGGVKWLTKITAGAHGELWAIGITPNPRYRYVRWITVLEPFVLILSLLAILVWQVRNFKRQRLADHQQLQQAAQHATGESSEELARTERRLIRESSWFGVSLSVLLPIVAFIGFQVLRLFWKSAPAWMFLLLALALHLVTVAWRSAVKKTPKPWDPIEPGGPGYDWSETRKVLPGTLALFVLLDFGEIQRYVRDPLLWVLVGLSLWSIHRTLAAQFLNRALHRAEYDAAGKVVLRFHLYSPDGAKALQHRTLVLLVSGRYREAEETARRGINATRSSGRQAALLDYLGSALVEQGRYDEATRAFEASLQAESDYPRPLHGLAETLLRQHRDPQRALEYLERIGSKRSLASLWRGRDLRDDYWAFKAWSLAELGRTAEVEPAIENAFRYTNRKSKPATAATNQRAGMAMLALGNEAKAREYLTRARDADPEGRWGKLAKEALGERSVFRA
jgi:tetratricopeptide (TPR) repeat protein